MYKQDAVGQNPETKIMQVVRTVIADDHPLFINGLENTLQEAACLPFQVLKSFENGQHLVDYLQKRTVDLLIMDLNLQELDGIEVIKSIRAKHLPLRILVFSRYQENQIIRSAMHAGADGFLLKTGDPREIISATQKVINRETYLGKGIQLGEVSVLKKNGARSFEDKFLKKYHLTKREIQILRLITDAKSNKEIASELFISDQTVGVHRKNIMRKIGVSNTAGLLKIAYDYCLV